MSQSKVPVTPEAIWSALVLDRAFLGHHQTQAEIDSYRELVGQLPAVLAELLDEPVSIMSIWKAKLTIAHHMQITKFVSRLKAALKREIGRVTAIMLEDSYLAGCIGGFEFAVRCLDSREYLDLIGTSLSEEEFLFDSTVGLGLGETLRSEFRSGRLTIGSLLLAQPLVLIDIFPSGPVRSEPGPTN